MKSCIKTVVVFALLTLASGLFMQVSAQNPNASSVMSVSGTLWAGKDSDGDFYEYAFMANGDLYYKSPSGFYTDGTWKQDGDSIYMETNNKYAEYQGQVSGTHMEGKAWNVKNRKWTWQADYQNLPASMANGGVPSISGTSWNISGTNGEKSVFTFVGDGTFSITPQNGSNERYVWNQDKDSIKMYIYDPAIDKIIVTYQGRVTGIHMEGTASNVNGSQWTWVADQK